MDAREGAPVPHSLQTYLESVEPSILRIEEPISTAHEITAMQHALGRDGRYPILLATAPVNADGAKSDMPVVTNISASRELTAAALGIPDHRQTARHYAAKAAAGVDPVIVKPGAAPVQEVVQEGGAADLTRLPVLTQHTLDPGPYLTAAHATTRDPDSGIDNTAVQRCWVKGPRLMSYFPYPRSHNARNIRKYWAKDEPCPVAFWIGHHPAVLMGAQAKLGYPESHWAAAGALAGEPVRLVPTVTHGDAVMVPADAEIVIEGFVPPHRMEADGPFGEYTSYFGPQVPAPVCEITAITHRRGAFYHDFGSGLADALIPDNMVNEGKLYAHCRRVAPSLVNVHMPLSGRRFHLYLQFDGPAPGEVRDALMAALSDRRPKAVFAFDADIDIFDERDVMWAIATRVQWHRDSVVVPGLSGSLLDPSLDAGARTAGKIAVDATRPAAPAGVTGAPSPVPPRIAVPDAALARARAILDAVDPDALARWPGL